MSEKKYTNLYITKIRPEINNLFIALSEIENISRAELFEAMLYDFTKKWMDVVERERGLEIDNEVMETLHEAVEESFLNQTIIYSARYMQIDQVPDDQKEAVLKRMSR